MPTPKHHLPVTVVCGMPGAGKTSLMEHLAGDAGTARIAIVTSDLRDTESAPRSVRVVRSPESFINLSPKGDAAVLREDLLIEIGRSAQAGATDALLVEISGLSDPLLIPETFSYDLDGKGHALTDLARIDTMVAVVDATSFLDDYKAARPLPGAPSDDDVEGRTVTDLLAEQVEWANILVLNKADLVTEQELRRLLIVLQQLNPRAEVHRTTRGRLSGRTVLNRKLCTMEHIGGFEHWLAHPPAMAASTEAESGVCSFVFRSDRPFHPLRLHEVMEEHWQSVLRSKGLLWLATRTDQAGIWSQAGVLLDMEWAPWDFGDSGLETGAEVEQYAPFADLGAPRQELVVVGLDLAKDKVLAGLEAALLTDDELNMPQGLWAEFPDPFSFDAPVNEYIEGDYDGEA